MIVALLFQYPGIDKDTTLKLDNDALVLDIKSQYIFQKLDHKLWIFISGAIWAQSEYHRPYPTPLHHHPLNLLQYPWYIWWRGGKTPFSLLKLKHYWRKVDNYVVSKIDLEQKTTILKVLQSQW